MTSLQTLDLAYNDIGPTLGPVVAELMEAPNRLCRLFLTANGLGVEGSSVLCEGLAQHHKLAQVQPSHASSRLLTPPHASSRLLSTTSSRRCSSTWSNALPNAAGAISSPP